MLREIVEPTSQPPGLTAERQELRKVDGVVCFGSMCSSTSKRVTISNCLGEGCEVDSGFEGVGVGGDIRSSRVVFRYWNFPLRICASMVGSMRAWSLAIWMSVVVGSMAVIEAARVGVGAEAAWSRGIVRASDSAKIPPPQPMSR